MGDKYVATVRFHTEGVEAELYGRLMEGKKEAGLSVPDYIKQILKEYFENKDWEDSRNEWLEQFGWEIAKVVERTVRNCISGGNVNAMGTGATLMADTEAADNQEEAGLPEQSEEIPEGALDFLDGME
jgi:hypothetical protein